MAHPSAVNFKSTETSSRQRRVAIVLYATTVFLFWFSQYIYVPTLPTFVQSKTTDLGIVGLVLSMYGLWQAVIRLPLGMAADWLGRFKPFIIAGVACSGIGAWIMVTSSDVEGLALGRGITGFAAGSWVPLVVAFTALFPPHEAVRASALLLLFNSLGRLVATALAGPLGRVGGYPLAFYVAIGVSALSLVTLLPFREESRPTQTPSPASVRQFIVRRDILLPAVLGGIVLYANWAISFGFMAVLVKQLGGDSVAQGAVVTGILVTTVLGNLFASSLASCVDSKYLVYASFALISFGIAWAALSQDLSMLFIAPVFLGIGGGIASPVLMGLSIENITGAGRSTAMGVYQTIYAIGMFAGPAVSGAIAGAVGMQTMFSITAFLCLILGSFGTSFLRTGQITSR